VFSRDTVTVCVPTLTTRAPLLSRALASVGAQTRPADALAVAVDADRAGAWVTRNRAARMARTRWVAFLDDDDELLPHHLEHLLWAAAEQRADVVWGWFEVVGGNDPFPPHFPTKQYDPAQPHVVPISYLVRRELLEEATEQMGGFLPDGSSGGAWDAQDGPLMTAMCTLGGVLCPTGEVTWRWHHHGKNTSGLPGKGS
jgi:hypothetical protein